MQTQYVRMIDGNPRVHAGRGTFHRPAACQRAPSAAHEPAPKSLAAAWPDGSDIIRRIALFLEQDLLRFGCRNARFGNVLALAW